MTTSRPATEQDIHALVRRFYALALDDELLGPMFRETIPDFEAHFPIVENFWSHSLLGTGRYSGSPFAHHIHLKVQQAHFDRWMAAFRQAVSETLPSPIDEMALKRAAHMTEAFKAGMLPLPDPRRPAKQPG